MSRRRWRWTRVVRAAALSALAVLCLVVVGFVVDRLRHKPEIFDKPTDPIGPTKIEVRDRVSFVEFRGDRSKVEAKADKQYKGPDGLNHLEGHVLIVDSGKTGGREIRMGGDAAAYDEGWTRIQVRGNATLQSKSLTVASTDFDYDKATETVRSSAGVRVVSPRLNGTARTLVYSVDIDEVVFEEALDFTMVPRDPSQAPVRITGRRFLYNQHERHGFFEGGVVFTQGTNGGKAGYLRFELFPDADSVRLLKFREAVEMTLEDPKAPPPPPTGASPAKAAGFAEFISFRARRQTITAGEVTLLPFEKTDRIQALLLWGGGSVKLLAENGNMTELAGQTIEFYYTREGELRDFSIEGGPRITGTQAATKQAKTLDGAAMSYQGAERTLRVKGTADRPARFIEPGRSLTCGILALYFRIDSFDAAERVSIVSTPREGGRGTSGFFTQSQPVIIRADAVRYNDSNQSFSMSGQVRMIQGRESLFVREVTILEETGEMRNAKDVVSTFIHTSRSRDKAQEERVTIEAASLDFDPRSQKIAYGGTGTLRTRDIELRAAAITVDLADGAIQKVLASQNVSVNQGKGAREATGGQAVYDAAAETIVLTDRPRLKDKAKGTVVNGEKLTFFLADGKIIVENRDVGQSFTSLTKSP